MNRTRLLALLLAAGSGRILGRRPPGCRPSAIPDVCHSLTSLFGLFHDLALSAANMEYIIHIIHSFVKVMTKRRDCDGMLCRFTILNREFVQSPPVLYIQKKTPCPQTEGHNFQGNSYSIARRGLRFLYWMRLRMESSAAIMYMAAASTKG